MELPINTINRFFDNISYNLTDYHNFITTTRLESFFSKALFGLVAFSIIKVFIFYALAKFFYIAKPGKKKNKKTIVICRGKKIIKGAINYSKYEYIIHTIYLSIYTLIYLVAGCIIIGGVL